MLSNIYPRSLLKNQMWLLILIFFFFFLKRVLVQCADNSRNVLLFHNREVNRLRKKEGISKGPPPFLRPNSSDYWLDNECRHHCCFQIFKWVVLFVSALANFREANLIWVLRIQHFSIGKNASAQLRFCPSNKGRSRLLIQRFYLAVLLCQGVVSTLLLPLCHTVGLCRNLLQTNPNCSADNRKLLLMFSVMKSEFPAGHMFC